MPPIHSAAMFGNLQEVKDLLLAGANVNEKDDISYTALHWASWKGHLNIVKYLVEQGKANVEAKTKFGSTPLNHASREGHLNVVKYLVEQGKANVEAWGNYGWTSLIHASREGHLNIVQYLVEHGKANVEAQRSHGWTPLIHASSEGHLHIVKYLVEQGKANLHALDNEGNTPLVLACSSAHRDQNIVFYLAQQTLPALCDACRKDRKGSETQSNSPSAQHGRVVKDGDNDCMITRPHHSSADSGNHLETNQSTSTIHETLEGPDKKRLRKN